MLSRSSRSAFGAAVILLIGIAPVGAQHPMNDSGPGMRGGGCHLAAAADNERTTQVGCWIVAQVPQGTMRDESVYWRLFELSSPAGADGTHDSTEAMIDALGKRWLFVIGQRGAAAPRGAKRVADIGPLHVKPGVAYTAQYMVAVFRPGTNSPVHRHSGPEAWYTLSGQVCLETPNDKFVGRAGEATIVPAGPPMRLTATGTRLRRSLVLVLHESALPATTLVSDWRPRGLCR